MPQHGFTSRRRSAAALAAGVLAASAVVSVGTATTARAAVGDTAWTAGLNSDGQLGNGTTTNRPRFGAVPGVTDVDDVAGGREHALALSGGQVYAWGDGSRGATGQGTLSDVRSATLVDGLGGVTAVTSGHYSSFALLADGTVRSWGFNGSGQLGDGTTATRTRPVTVSGLGGVAQIAAGRDMAMALLADGTVRTWGRGTDGELGIGTFTTSRRTPVAVPGLTDVVHLAGGRNHVLAVREDGTVWAWGQNAYGQLGDGTLVRRNAPVRVQGVSDAVAVEAGAEFSLALLADGTVMSWGRSNSGQLGRGDTVTRPVAGVVPGLPPVAELGCGRGHALAVSTTGQLYGWGLDNYGQLGDRAGSRRVSPVLISQMTGVKDVHGGYGYSVIQR